MADPGGFGEARSLAAFEEALGGFVETLSDLHFETLEMVAEDNKVAVHLLANGHHTGVHWLGLEAVGAYVEWHTRVICTFRDGTLASENLLDDNYTIMKAPGVGEI